MTSSKGLAMSWGDWGKRDAVALADLVRAKQVTAQELVAQAAAAVERLNPELGAVLEIYEDVLKDAMADGPNKDGRLYGGTHTLEGSRFWAQGTQTGVRLQALSELCDEGHRSHGGELSARRVGANWPLDHT